MKTIVTFLMASLSVALGFLSCRNAPTESSSPFVVTVEKKLEAPIPYRPKDDRNFLQPTLLYLGWNPVKGAGGYFVELSRSRDFSVLEFSASVNERRTVTPVLSRGTYYWRVRAFDTLGNMSGWSQQLSFSIQMDAGN